MTKESQVFNGISKKQTPEREFSDLKRRHPANYDDIQLQDAELGCKR